MTIYDIVLYPDTPLRDKAKPFDDTEFGPKLEKLAENMIATMFENDGVGLAGPQIGLSKRIFVLCEPEGEPQCFVNPTLSDLDGRENGEEGCLSMPKIYGQVPRATSLHIEARTPLGDPIAMDAEGFLARIMQHEYDHLDGVMFPDRLDILSREALYRDWESLREAIENGDLITTETPS